MPCPAQSPRLLVVAEQEHSRTGGPADLEQSQRLAVAELTCFIDDQNMMAVDPPAPS